VAVVLGDDGYRRSTIVFYGAARAQGAQRVGARQVGITNNERRAIRHVDGAHDVFVVLELARTARYYVAVERATAHDVGIQLLAIGAHAVAAHHREVVAAEA
nr:hypothetical protein [Tanacetum cinerariifolium]